MNRNTLRIGQSRAKKALAYTLLAFTVALTLQNAPAQIVANFDGGNSNSEVDAWRGMAGEGWNNAWQTTANSDATVSGTVTNTNPLVSGGGNYLQYTITNNSPTALRNGGVARRYENYGAVNLAKENIISFEFRLDSPLSAFDRIYLFDSTAASLSAETAPTTWLIRLNSSGSIVVFNGTSSVTTSLSLAQGETFRFTIHALPSEVAADSTYSVQIENLTAQTTYQSGSLAFYSPQTTVGGYLNFTTRVPVGQQATMSLDSINVIPEPSQVALLWFGMVALIVIKVLKPKRMQNQDV